jgi:hypothetical protein
MKQEMIQNGMPDEEFTQLNIPILNSALRYFHEKGELCHGSELWFHNQVELNKVKVDKHLKEFMEKGRYEINGKEKIDFDENGHPYLVKPLEQKPSV